MFKQLKIFQFDNGPEFKRDVTKLTGKHNIGFRKATAKYTYIVFAKVFNKRFTKTFFEPMDAQDVQDINEKLCLFGLKFLIVHFTLKRSIGIKKYKLLTLSEVQIHIG